MVVTVETELPKPDVLQNAGPSMDSGAGDRTRMPTRWGMCLLQTSHVFSLPVDDVTLCVIVYMVFCEKSCSHEDTGRGVPRGL